MTPTPDPRRFRSCGGNRPPSHPGALPAPACPFGGQRARVPAWLAGVFLVGAILVAGTFGRAAPAEQESGYIPHRVYGAGEKRFIDFEAMVADLARADVVAVGEQHDDPSTHRLELALLEALARRKRRVVVSLEMFERDVQKSVDDYLASRVSEGDFLAASRPWPRYATDYRALIELADRSAWRVVAANVPRRIASEVGKTGLAAIDRLAPADRAWVAADLHCPVGDDYFARFEKEMTQHPPSPGQGETTKAMVERFYYAQCVKDETMAESIARALEGAAEPRPLAVHYNGAFHSDYRAGVVARVERRLPNARVRVVSMVPVEDLDRADPAAIGPRGDYLVFTIKQEAKPAPPAAAR